MTRRRRLREVHSDADGEAIAAAETLRVRRWRFDQLVEAGYAAQDASALARNSTIDLELARRLVQRLGCPPELAVKILA